MFPPVAEEEGKQPEYESWVQQQFEMEEEDDGGDWTIQTSFIWWASSEQRTTTYALIRDLNDTLYTIKSIQPVFLRIGISDEQNLQHSEPAIYGESYPVQEKMSRRFFSSLGR